MHTTSELPLTSFLNTLVQRLEDRTFIEFDPIAIPHGFDDPRDQEVIGLYAALLAWGRRSTILGKMEDLCERMDYQPYRFVRDFRIERDSGKLAGFKHRTFKPEDAQWLTANLGALVRRFGSVEQMFAAHLDQYQASTETAIQGFSESVMTANPSTPKRLSKHLARPRSGSACKRLNMYLRWMVRPGPFDLGIWPSIRTEQLILPLDVHSGRQARRLGMLKRATNDWKAAVELTEVCRRMDPADPCRYDLALFGIGAHNIEVPDALLSTPART